MVRNLPLAEWALLRQQVLGSQNGGEQWDLKKLAHEASRGELEELILHHCAASQRFAKDVERSLDPEHDALAAIRRQTEQQIQYARDEDGYLNWGGVDTVAEQLAGIVEKSKAMTASQGLQTAFRMLAFVVETASELEDQRAVEGSEEWDSAINAAVATLEEVALAAAADLEAGSEWTDAFLRLADGTYPHYERGILRAALPLADASTNDGWMHDR